MARIKAWHSLSLSLYSCCCINIVIVVVVAAPSQESHLHKCQSYAACSTTLSASDSGLCLKSLQKYTNIFGGTPYHDTPLFPSPYATRFAFYFKIEFRHWLCIFLFCSSIPGGLLLRVFCHTLYVALAIAISVTHTHIQWSGGCINKRHSIIRVVAEAIPRW